MNSNSDNSCPIARNMRWNLGAAAMNNGTDGAEYLEYKERAASKHCARRVSSAPNAMPQIAIYDVIHPTRFKVRGAQSKVEVEPAITAWIWAAREIKCELALQYALRR